MRFPGAGRVARAQRFLGLGHPFGQGRAEAESQDEEESADGGAAGRYRPAGPG